MKKKSLVIILLLLSIFIFNSIYTLQLKQNKKPSFSTFFNKNYSFQELKEKSLTFRKQAKKTKNIHLRAKYEFICLIFLAKSLTFYYSNAEFRDDLDNKEWLYKNEDDIYQSKIDENWYLKISSLTDIQKKYNISFLSDEVQWYITSALPQPQFECNNSYPCGDYRSLFPYLNYLKLFPNGLHSRKALNFIETFLIKKTTKKQLNILIKNHKENSPQLSYVEQYQKILNQVKFHLKKVKSTKKISIFKMMKRLIRFLKQDN